MLISGTAAFESVEGSAGKFDQFERVGGAGCFVSRLRLTDIWELIGL